MTSEQESQPVLATQAPAAQQAEAGDSARCCADDGADAVQVLGEWEMADV